MGTQKIVRRMHTTKNTQMLLSTKGIGSFFQDKLTLFYKYESEVIG
jgi:hypothetical protein